MTYYATPATRCECPSKGFTDAPTAFRYAERSAKTFRVGYAVWRIQAGIPRRLKTFAPGPPVR